MEKLKLLSHLKELTDKPLMSLIDSFNVTELYEGVSQFKLNIIIVYYLIHSFFVAQFEFTGNYLLDINRYKSMFRRRNLLKLHKAPL